MHVHCHNYAPTIVFGLKALPFLSGERKTCCFFSFFPSLFVHPLLFKLYFHRVQCFSSVVGPNGSGKSNVIDAMLFVFGYRASKIRQGKLRYVQKNKQWILRRKKKKEERIGLDWIGLDRREEGERADPSVFVCSQTFDLLIRITPRASVLFD